MTTPDGVVPQQYPPDDLGVASTITCPPGTDSNGRSPPARQTERSIIRRRVRGAGTPPAQPHRCFPTGNRVVAAVATPGPWRRDTAPHSERPQNPCDHKTLSKDETTVQTHDDQEVPGLHPRRTPGGAQRIADPRRSQPDVRQRRAWFRLPSSARPGPHRSPAPPAAGACAPLGHRRGRASPPPQHVLPDGGNFSFGDYFKREAIEFAGRC